MQRSSERILTTHTGSLPRPPELIDLLQARDLGELPAAAEARLHALTREAVAEVVRRQIEVGIDLVNDGEMGKIGYSTYVKERLTGFGGEGRGPRAADLLDFPDYAKRLRPAPGEPRIQTPACVGPVAYRDVEAVRRDLDNLTAALRAVGRQPGDGFVTAASPGVISLFMENQHYPGHEAYLTALAEAMKVEYDAIHRAGFVLQVDCPDLAAGRHLQFAAADLAEFRRHLRRHVEALNHALADVPPDRLRLHLCWGNYEGPHHRDVPLADVLDLVLEAKPAAISFEAANPRHEHEWRVFERVRLPEDKVLIPGVIDSTTNFVEHPELVAERLDRFASVVGRQRVIAGTDCGMATFAGSATVDPAIAWAKLASLVEGAEIASRQLWPPS
jgi:5-methyltetrahydropteroyltriglutamate--homocysteine methyltransferase